MKLTLTAGKKRILLRIKKDNPVSEQIMATLEKENLKLEDLDYISYEKFKLYDFSQVDEWYTTLDRIAGHNLRKYRALSSDELFDIQPTDKQNALSSFYNLYPKNRLWQLVVDGRLYAKNIGHTIQQRNHGEAGWNHYEMREKNSLAAYFSGLKLALGDIDNIFISHDLITRLHGAVTRNVVLNETRNIDKGYYRKQPPHFTLHTAQGDITPEGLTDLLDKMESGDLGTLNEENEDGVFLAYRATEPMTEYRFLTPHNLQETKKKFVLEGKIGDTNNSSLVNYLLQDNNQFHYNAVSSFDLMGALDRVINHYNETIRTLKDPDQILQLIGETTQAFERIHPFGDANGRTFVNLLQNRLLIQNGFPPATLYQPNLYDAYGNVVAVLKRGIQNTLDIYAGKDIFGYHLHRLHNEKEQEIFDQNSDLDAFKMQRVENHFFKLLENSGQPLNKDLILASLDFADDPLLKLDYIDDAIDKYADDSEKMILLHEVYHDIAREATPLPESHPVNEHFNRMAFQLEIEHRLANHENKPAVQQIAAQSKEKEYEINAELGIAVVPAVTTEQNTILPPPNEDDELKKKSDDIVEEFLMVEKEEPGELTDFIDLLEQCAEGYFKEMKQNPSWQAKFFSFINPSPSDFTPQQKYGACNHLIKLLQTSSEEALNSDEVEILTSSTLGKKLKPFDELMMPFITLDSKEQYKK